jgi:large subunit ribosomal protein L22
MGRAYRYQRRMAHIEIALGERQRGGNGSEPVATVVGAEAAPAKPARKRAPAKKAAAKKSGAKKSSAKKGGKK